jgi:hydroxyacylglutathione hydrolase
MQATVEKIILTHAHVDHCAASDVLRQQLGVPIEGPHPDDIFWLEKLPQWCQMSGFPVAEAFTPDRWLDDGDTVTVGELVLDVVHCPGHTPGHVVFIYPPDKVAWVGDVLFQGSIGRTDFPRGNHQDLISSIREKLFPLGDDITFIPGHGPTSTFGQERRSNPYVADGVST